MATDDHHDAPDRQTVFEDLAARLQELRGGAHAADLGQALYRRATDGTELVALVDDGERAVFYEATDRVVTAVPLARHGLVTADAEDRWTGVGDPSTWVDATDADRLAWVHPRYRWVVSSDRSSWWHVSTRP